MTLPPASHAALTALLLAAGAATGALLQRLGTPLPFMLGSLAAAALAVGVAQSRFPEGYVYPMRFRVLFVGVIGTMIGARLTPDAAGLLPKMLVLIPAVLVFTLAAHALTWRILRHLGGYDRPTACSAGAPRAGFTSRSCSARRRAQTFVC